MSLCEREPPVCAKVLTRRTLLTLCGIPDTRGPVVIGISRKVVGVEELNLRPLVPNET